MASNLRVSWDNLTAEAEAELSTLIGELAAKLPGWLTAGAHVVLEHFSDPVPETAAAVEPAVAAPAESTPVTTAAPEPPADPAPAPPAAEAVT